VKRETPPFPRNIISSRLRSLRKAAKPRISQDDLCGKLAVLGITISRSQIAKIEAGTRPVTDYELVALCLALGVLSRELLPEDLSGLKQGAQGRGR
jgi:transcriptional regulator with XRE-family HTH domain